MCIIMYINIAIGVTMRTIQMTLDENLIKAVYRQLAKIKLVA